LTFVFLAGILLALSGLVTVVIVFGGSLGLDTFSSTSSGLAIHLSPAFYALAFTTSFVELLVVLFCWGAFRTLARFDPRFSTPAKLTLVLAIADVLVIAVLYPLLSQLNSAFSCIGTTTNETLAAQCISPTLANLILLLLLIAVLAVVGYIGLLVGIWRLGTRYENGLFKAGAILLLIPLLNFVGAVLVLVAAHTVREQFDRAPPPSAYQL
jgi:Protein of unknown function (DUF973)